MKLSCAENYFRFPDFHLAFDLKWTRQGTNFSKAKLKTSDNRIM